MATTISTITIGASVNWDATNVLTLSTGHDKSALTYVDSLTAGTSADQCTGIYHIQGTIASGGTTNIDVSGSLTDMFGNACVFTKIKGILLINKGIASGSTYTETSGENIIVSTSTLTAAIHTAPIEPGGCMLFTSPKVGGPVTATSADLITMTRAGSSTVTYQIVIWGLV